MIKLDFEDMKYLSTEDYKAIQDLRNYGFPDESINEAIKRQASRMREEEEKNEKVKSKSAEISRQNEAR